MKKKTKLKPTIIYYEVMKNFYCSRCNNSSKKLLNCKYEKNDSGYFLLCGKCAFECSEIFKRTFKSKSGKFVSIGLLKSRKERSLFKF